MQRAERLIRDFWPNVREVYVSPLSNDGVIKAWQVEVMLCGNETRSFENDTLAGAFDGADAYLRLLQKASQ